MAMKNPYNYSKPKNYMHTFNDSNSKPVEEPKKEVNRAGDYLTQKVMTASPQELTLMLYDGLIRFIKQSKMFIEDKEIEKTHNAIIRAEDIVDELNITLKMEFEVSQGLRTLYIFMKDKLMEANVEKNVVKLEEALLIATELRDTWKQAMPMMKM